MTVLVVICLKPTTVKRGRRLERLRQSEYGNDVLTHIFTVFHSRVAFVPRLPSELLAS